MRKLIAVALVAVLMVAIAAPAAQARDNTTANLALGLAAFAVFSQFVIPMLNGQPAQPAYAPAPPVYPGPAYYPPGPAYYPPPPVVEPRVYMEPAPAPYPHRPHGSWHYEQQSRSAHPWGWGARGSRGPGVQSQ